MIGIVRAEWLKLWKRPAARVIALIWVVLVLVLGYLLPYMVFKNPSRGADSTVRIADAVAILGLLPQNLVHWFVPGLTNLGGTLIVILAALIGGSEYGWTTLKTMLTQRPGRLKIFIGKLLALFFLLIIFVLLGYLAAALGSLVVASLEGAQVGWPPALDVAKSAGAMLLIFAAWAALGFGLAIIVRGTALAIGLGLVYGLVIDGLIVAFSGISDLMKSVSQGLLGTNASALLDVFRLTTATRGFGGERGAPIAGPGQAAAVLVLYIVVFLVVAGFLLERRDIT